MGSYFSKPWDPSTAIPDLSGKVFIVTGANSGIGFATAEQLASHGAKVYVATRSEAKAHAAIEKIYANNKQVKAGRLIFLLLDLADLDSVTKAAEIFLKEEDRLDVLVNNAGVLTWDYQTTKQGFELVTGVNHVGHFLLTVKLLPILKATANGKGSDVSAAGHRIMMPELTFTSLSDFNYPGIVPSPPDSTGVLNQISRNAVSKSANILFASELQRRMDLENIPIISTSLSPGAVATEGIARIHFGLLGPLWWLIKTFASRSPQKGAVPSLYLATAEEVRERRVEFAGKYVESNLKVVAPSKLASNPKLARNLWVLSEEAVAKWMAT
ncbi:hypothetical protein P7C71_g5577, partial [Lecanoromycetidae sp. Uapishka_2]